MEHIFIYGTLAPGRPNEDILADIKGTWLAATVNGTLKEEGWGAEMGYPGIILDKSENEVEGFVFSSEELDKKWAMLDEFEGKEYKRITTKAKLLNEDIIENVYIYALNKNN